MSEATENLDSLRAVMEQALSGRGSHVRTAGALDGLEWNLAGEKPGGVPHSIFELLNHIVYWQDFALAWIDGDKPPTPEHAQDSWPGGQAAESAEEWQQLVDRYEAGLARFGEAAGAADLFVERRKKTTLEILQMIASHNSYHVGQVAQLRRVLDSWPPPSGGETW